MAALFSLSFGLWLFLTLLWVGLHCEIVVFPDQCACTDPGNIVGERGGGRLGPSATSFFSHQLNLRFFSFFLSLLVRSYMSITPGKKKIIISKTPGGGVQYFPGGGGGVTSRQCNTQDKLPNNCQRPRLGIKFGEHQNRI